MESKDLCRIADALELIVDRLVGIEAHLSDLAECISKSNAGNQFCITGQMTNYEP